MFPPITATTSDSRTSQRIPQAGVWRTRPPRWISLICGAVLGMGILAPPTVTSQCIDYADYTPVGVDLPGTARGVAVSGDYAYIAADTGGLQVVDISDPGSPQVVAELEVPSGTWHVTVAGHYAYVSAAEQFYIVNIEDPFAPAIVGQTGTRSRGLIAVSGSYAYIADIIMGLLIMDVSDPTAPTILSITRSPLWTLDVAIAGRYAYVVGETGFRVIDVLDPALPIELARIPIPGGSGGVTVSGGYAYVTTWQSGFAVVDIADPTSPVVVGTNEEPSGPTSVAVSGDVAWVSTLGDGLIKMDISNPAQPTIIDSYDTARTNKVVMAGRYAYLASQEDGLRVVDTFIPSPPSALLGSSPYFADFLRSVAVSGNLAYVGSKYSGIGKLLVMDVSNPIAPALLGEVETLSGVRDIRVEGDLVYVTNWDLGLQIVDASDPTAPTIIGAVDTPGWAGGFTVSGDYAYVGTLTYGLQVLNISDPTMPAIEGFQWTSGWARDVTVSGDYAFVGEELGSAGRLEVFDVSNRASPTLVGSIDLAEVPYGIEVSRSYAYIAASGWTGDSGSLQVVDISSPQSPVIVGSVSTSRAARNVSVIGTRAYITGGDLGVEVADITDPTHPTILGGIPWNGGMLDVASDGHHTYVIDDRRFHVLTAQCDESPVPVLLSGFSATALDQSVEVTWFTSFESAHDGFHVYRSGRLDSGFTRLNEKLLQGRSPYSYLDSTVLPASTYYYKLGAVDSHGRELLHPPTSVTTPGVRTFRTALAPGAPNPFRKETTLTFTLAAPTEAILAIYDVSGRLVRQVLSGNLPEGEHSVTWDGRDDSGLKVAGGTYFVRFGGGNVSRAEKIVFLGN